MENEPITFESLVRRRDHLAACIKEMHDLKAPQAAIDVANTALWAIQAAIDACSEDAKDGQQST